MLTVGVTGGYATGKSFVAGELERLGSKLISADKLGHEALLPSGEAYEPAIALFGSSIVGPDGYIDRKKLGHIVFADPALLAKLTAIVHPAVFKLEAKLTAKYAEQDPAAVVVTEAAILIETGRYKMFDRLIVTVCSPETQVARGMKRDRLSREDVMDRIRHQIPLEEKRRYAHYIVDTDAPKAETIAQVEVIFRDLKRIAVNA